MINGGDDVLPPIINLRNPAIAYDVWVLWRATERRFLPSQLLAEPIGLLDDMLYLDGIYEMLKARRDGNKND